MEWNIYVIYKPTATRHSQIILLVVNETDPLTKGNRLENEPGNLSRCK